MRYILLLAVSVLFIGCTGPGQSINSGEIGKVSNEDEIRGEGTFNLDYKLIGVNDKLIKAQVGLTTHVIGGKYFIPKSDLRVGLNIAIQVKVRDDEQSQRQVLGLTTTITDGGASLITSKRMFDVYIMKGLRSTIRQALSKYKIEDIILNLGSVEKEISDSIVKLAESSPLEVYTATFDSIEWPEPVIIAKEAAAEIAATKKNRMLQLAADLEVKAAERQLQILNARLAVEADAIIAPSMGPKMATWMMLEAIQECARKENCNIDIHPAMLPQNAFNFSNDTVDYSSYRVPEAEINQLKEQLINQ